MGGSRETVRGALSVMGRYSAGVWGRQPPAAGGQRGLGRSPSRGPGDRVPGGGLVGGGPPPPGGGKGGGGGAPRGGRGEKAPGGGGGGENPPRAIFRNQE